MFNKNFFVGQLIQGKLRGAMEYLSQYPQQNELYNKYVSVFEKENYLIHEGGGILNEILIAYQKYYREIFYLEAEKEEAEKKLRNAFIGILGIDKDISAEEAEDLFVNKAFTDRGFYFRGGRTGGYLGPYIWTKEEVKKYKVELPDGNSEYTVTLLDGFVSASWLDYISFGEVGTGGWTDENGTVNCIRQKYDLSSEDFTVSLLKHEAQHAEDMRKFKDISSEELEYRAKLVELVYSEERNLLPIFILQADSSDPANGHAMAAERIVKGFEEKLGVNRAELEKIAIKKVQATALQLFRESGPKFKQVS